MGQSIGALAVVVLVVVHGPCDGSAGGPALLDRAGTAAGNLPLLNKASLISLPFLALPLLMRTFRLYFLLVLSDYLRL